MHAKVAIVHADLDRIFLRVLALASLLSRRIKWKAFSSLQALAMVRFAYTIKVWKEHRQWVTNVHLQRGGQRELVSGCRSGEVKLWDMRWDKSIKTVKATKDTLRTLSVHEHAPVFAA